MRPTECLSNLQTRTPTATPTAALPTTISMRRRSICMRCDSGLSIRPPRLHSARRPGPRPHHPGPRVCHHGPRPRHHGPRPRHHGLRPRHHRLRHRHCGPRPRHCGPPIRPCGQPRRRCGRRRCHRGPRRHRRPLLPPPPPSVLLAAQRPLARWRPRFLPMLPLFLHAPFLEKQHRRRGHAWRGKGTAGGGPQERLSGGRREQKRDRTGNARKKEKQSRKMQQVDMSLQYLGDGLCRGRSHHPRPCGYNNGRGAPQRRSAEYRGGQ